VQQNRRRIAKEGKLRGSGHQHGLRASKGAQHLLGTFCIMVTRLAPLSELHPIGRGATRLTCELGGTDPKPSDLISARLNAITKLEGRSGGRCKVLARAVMRSERLIKLGHIWFSAKYILV